MEDSSLNYEEIKVTYTEGGPDGRKKGNVEYTWRVEERKVVSTTNERTVTIEDVCVLSKPPRTISRSTN